MEHIPVDICVKGMIVVSERHKKGCEFPDAIPVYNAASTRVFTADDVEAMYPHLRDHLLDQAIGLPWVVRAPNNFIAGFFRFFLQIFPALIIDGLLVLFKRKPKVMKLQRILAFTENALEFFVKNQLSFDNRKFNGLGANLHKDDKEDFNLLPQTPMMEYLIKSFITTRENVLKETAESAARAKRKEPYYKAFGWMIKLFVLYLGYKLLFFFYGVVKNYQF